MFANVQEEWLLPKIIKEMAPVDGNRFTVAQAPGNDFLVGKTLAQLQDMYGVKDSREALLKLMIATKMRGIALYENLNTDLMKKAIASKRALIASNAPSLDSANANASNRQLKSDRTTQTFRRLLELVERDKLMPSADAIRKITFEPAKKLGLLDVTGTMAGRGEIKEGNDVDLACWKSGEVKFTVVNGKVVMRGGAFQDKFSGQGAALQEIKLS